MDESEQNDFRQGLPRRTRIGIGIGVAVLMVGMAAALVNALAPNFTAAVKEKVLSTITVTITAPETPPPPPPPQAKPKAAGDEGAAGKKAVPKEVKAPPSKLPISKTNAPAAASTGQANTSGAVSQGSGTGAGTQGSGTGAGGTGSGTGGGKPSKAEHIGGQINNSKDFPIPPGGREARVGKAVILALTVAPSGRATACRVYKSSGFPETDAVACTLAIQRLRFKPATNAAGEAVTSTFYWQQKFFF
jgi:periplasmic protein TonB